MNHLLACVVIVLAAVAMPPEIRASDAAPSPADIELFENHIRPVLVESCYGCHSQQAGTVEGELTLDNRAGLLRGGRSGPAVVPGEPQNSRLLVAIEYHDPSLQMPPDGKLPDEVIARFREWIARGAADPRDGTAAAIDTIASRSAGHWAFQPPAPPPVPDDPTDWSTTTFDRLIAAELRSAGLAPTTAADRRTLIHRVYFDLTGLAPGHDEVEAFANDPAEDAYERLVDRLLDAPQFGERWARHWLDVARFADTKGYVFTEDRNYPHAYKYRDWVIEAFNRDMPLDQFLRYQIAADQLISADDQRQHLAALGYLTLGRRFINNQHDIIADRIDVVFRGMMGLTVACARCHDHKYDPISDEDYYALYGVLASSREVQDDDLPVRLVDKQQPENVGVFIRGAAHNRGEIVQRGLPEFFAHLAEPVTQGSGRRQLAEAITHPENPLTARVLVNRVWGHLFGEQLVATPSDFGLRCDPPRQQAVLDHLAVELVEHRWSLKWLVRALVTSSTYRQSTHASDELLAADPENQLWGRAQRRRLDFEALRDRLLDAAGRLDTRVGGESERIDTADGGTRRTLYAHIDRQNLPSLFRTFDFASPDAHSPERPHTLVPQQALYLLNSPLVHRVATEVANAHADLPPDQRIDALYRHLLARSPTADEQALAQQFVAQPQPAPLEPKPWRFGYGSVQVVDGHPAVQFEPLAHFVDNRWQARDQFPDERMGYVSVTPTGGHPGNRPECGSIRRWIAPSGGRLQIDGLLDRPEQQGDGVEAWVVTSQQGIVGHWIVEHGRQPTAVTLEQVHPGEQVDFVVACRENPAFDSFRWTTTLALETRATRQTWSSEQDFHGPAPPPLAVWSQLAQVLLMSNEFLYVD